MIVGEAAASFCPSIARTEDTGSTQEAVLEFCEDMVVNVEDGHYCTTCSSCGWRADTTEDNDIDVDVHFCDGCTHMFGVLSASVGRVACCCVGLYLLCFGTLVGCFGIILPGPYIP